MRRFLPLARERTPAVAVLPLLLALGGCNAVVMNPAGDVALQQRNLILYATALMLLIIVPVLVLTALFAWRYRAGNAAATFDPEFDHSTSLELVIWSCPLLIVICLGALTWTSTHLLDPFRPLGHNAWGRPIAPGTRTLDVQVVAMDWKWLFIYPAQGIATVNELAMPVGVPVRFRITSTSQMNTFYAPTLAGMVYAMPGMRSELNAMLNRAGESAGYSANYTGAGFSDMRFRLHGFAAADFARWVAEVKRGGTLDAGGYLRLDKPSEKVAAMRFGTVTPGLFDRVVNRCVAPGRPCAADVMAHDRGGAMAMPPGREGAPLTGEKPTPALGKAPEDKGSGPNVTKPRAPGAAPGQKAPGDGRNRDMSALPSPAGRA